MAIGSYGTKRVSDVSVDDIEIIYHYSKTLNSNEVPILKKLDASNILTPVFHNSLTTNDVTAVNNELLGGMYNLKLETQDFSNLGFYTLFIRPKVIKTVISDCGVLSSLPSVRGLIIDLNNSKLTASDKEKFTPQNLVGYRIEYIDTLSNKKLPNTFRIVTSNFYCEPVTTNINNSTQKSIRYRYTDKATNLVFLTLTPSASVSTRPSVIPFIGTPNQTINLSNTFFDPTTVQIEMVEHNAGTLANALYGSQTKSIEDGIYTIYDSDKNIYKQYNLFEIKDDFNQSLYEVREERDQIDETKTFDDIVNE